MHIIGLAAVLVVSAGYVILHGLSSGLFGSAAGDGPGAPRMVWQTVDRGADGFKVEMPAEAKQVQVPAYSQTSAAEPVNMILANPDAETTFSVAWADNPPVARGDGQAPGRVSPDRVLEMAEEGALARTQTSAASSASGSEQGFPRRDFTASNPGGGVMSSRLIYAGARLYMLVAAFPSANARRDRDVARFFDSFTILPPATGARSGTAEPAASN